MKANKPQINADDADKNNQAMLDLRHLRLSAAKAQRVSKPQINADDADKAIRQCLICVHLRLSAAKAQE